MYRTCPKCGHTRTADDPVSADACPACGLIYAKYMKQRFASATPVSSEPDARPGRWRRRLLEMPAEPAMVTTGRVCLLAALVIYGFRLARMDVPGWEMAGSFIHLAMVPLHEFGHLLFMAFGEFMHLLGGSLFQVALPLALGAAFLRRGDPFAAAVMLWWSAVAVMDVAPYIYDAQQPVHVLLTGRTGETGAHDFIDVLGDLGLLKRAQAVGYAVHRVGLVMLVAALAWAGAVVSTQWRERAAGRGR